MRITYEEIKSQQTLVWLLQASELDPTDQQDRLDDLHMLARARLRRAFERLALLARVDEGLTVGIERLAFRACLQAHFLILSQVDDIGTATGGLIHPDDHNAALDSAAEVLRNTHRGE